jgi:hypothetical protein
LEARVVTLQRRLVVDFLDELTHLDGARCAGVRAEVVASGLALHALQIQRRTLQSQLGVAQLTAIPTRAGVAGLVSEPQDVALSRAASLLDGVE